MGALNSKNNSDTINWDNIKTDNISSSLPNFNGLSSDAKQLIASLNIPAITDTQTSEFTVNHLLDTINTNLNDSDQKKFNGLLEQVSSRTQSDDLSDTSPFISPEMYKDLVNSKTSTENNAQKGGAKKSKSHKKNKKGGWSLNDNDSDTSSTSSDSDLNDLIDSTEEEIINNKNAKKNKKSKESSKKVDTESEMSGGELSYLSSSAHTGGDFSDSDNANNTVLSMQSSNQTTSESTQISSQDHTSNHSVSDENRDMEMERTSANSNSVNTSDINMVSDY
jgi:hypothetical protein